MPKKRPPKPKVQRRISLLVPFKEDVPARSELWRWLRKYWAHELAGEVEIVVGHDASSMNGRLPFSKTRAVNDAFRRSTGDVIVILDADTYLPGSVIRHAANRIRQARRSGVRLWFVPYRTIYRLTPEATDRVLDSDPRDPYRFPSPPSAEDVEDTTGSAHGHKFGALIMIMPREAFEAVGCMDPRFRGWGGEDVSFLRAVDTLWARHKNLHGDVLHLWHPKLSIGHNEIVWKTRAWSGQAQPRANEWLAVQYDRATNKPRMMRKLVDEGCRYQRVLWRFWSRIRVIHKHVWLRRATR